MLYAQLGGVVKSNFKWNSVRRLKNNIQRSSTVKKHCAVIEIER